MMRKVGYEGYEDIEYGYPIQFTKYCSHRDTYCTSKNHMTDRQIIGTMILGFYRHGKPSPKNYCGLHLKYEIIQEDVDKDDFKDIKCSVVEWLKDGEVKDVIESVDLDSDMVGEFALHGIPRYIPEWLDVGCIRCICSLCTKTRHM